jgi:hypothetical protein
VAALRLLLFKKQPAPGELLLQRLFGAGKAAIAVLNLDAVARHFKNDNAVVAINDDEVCFAVRLPVCADDLPSDGVKDKLLPVSAVPSASKVSSLTLSQDARLGAALLQLSPWLRAALSKAIQFPLPSVPHRHGERTAAIRRTPGGKWASNSDGGAKSCA